MRDIAELKFENTLPSIRSEDFLRFQQITGVELPSDYVRFLGQVNGGNPELDLFRLKDGEEWAASTFYHLTMDENDTDGLLWNFLAHKHLLPVNVLPIASDAGGNQICLDLRPGARCQVVVWDHESASRLLPAADTFDHFIDSLYFDPDYV